MKCSERLQHTRPVFFILFIESHISTRYIDVKEHLEVKTKFVFIVMHFGFFNLLTVLWNMVKSEAVVRMKGYDPVMREVADQNTTLQNLGLGPMKSRAVRRAERLAAQELRRAEEARTVCAPGPALTGRTAHVLHLRRAKQPQPEQM